MGSTEDSMGLSLDTPSPSITPLNSLRTQHDSLSPPLTPVPKHAGTCLSTPSPLCLQSDDTSFGELEQLEILNQPDQPVFHRTSSTANCLVEDAAIVLALVTMDQILSPQKQIFSMIKESRSQPLSMFILDKLYQLRSKLHLPDQYLPEESKMFKGYVNELYDAYRQRNEGPVVSVCIGTSPHPLSAVLARLKSSGPDIGAIDYHGLKMSEFAIILGSFLGRMGCFIDPNDIRTEEHMFAIGTVVASGDLEAFIHSLRPLDEQ